MGQAGAQGHLVLTLQMKREQQDHCHSEDSGSSPRRWGCCCARAPHSREEPQVTALSPSRRLQAERPILRLLPRPQGSRTHWMFTWTTARVLLLTLSIPTRAVLKVCTHSCPTGPASLWRAACRAPPCTTGASPQSPVPRTQGGWASPCCWPTGRRTPKGTACPDCPGRTDEVSKALPFPTLGQRSLRGCAVTGTQTRSCA